MKLETGFPYFAHDGVTRYRKHKYVRDGSSIFLAEETWIKADPTGPYLEDKHGNRYRPDGWSKWDHGRHNRRPAVYESNFHDRVVVGSDSRETWYRSDR